MGMVHAYKQGKLKKAPKKIRDVAKHISDDDARDFAKTKHDGLEEKKAFDFADIMSKLERIEKKAQYATPLVGAAIGAGLGAIFDKKKRLRGALLGALAGGGMGYAASPYLEKGKKVVDAVYNGKVEHKGKTYQLQDDNGNGVGGAKAVDNLLNDPSSNVNIVSDDGKKTTVSHESTPVNGGETGLFDADGNKIMSFDEMRKAYQEGKPVTGIVRGNHKFVIDRNGKTHTIEVGDGTRLGDMVKVPEPPKEIPEEQRQAEEQMRRWESGKMTPDEVVDTLVNYGALHPKYQEGLQKSIATLDQTGAARVATEVNRLAAEGKLAPEVAETLRTQVINTLKAPYRQNGATDAQAAMYALRYNKDLADAIQAVPEFSEANINDAMVSRMDDILKRYNRLAEERPEEADLYAPEAARDIIKLRMERAMQDAEMKFKGTDTESRLARGNLGWSDEMTKLYSIPPDKLRDMLGFNKGNCPILRDKNGNPWLDARGKPQIDVQALRQIYIDRVKQSAAAPWMPALNRAEAALAAAQREYASGRIAAR